MIAMIRGTVGHGKRLGRTLGFPTANIEPSSGALPEDGVYVGEMFWDGRGHPCAVNVGSQPTLPSGQRRLEAHLIGFDGDLYGQSVEIRLYHRVRAERRFGSVEALRAQLDADIRAVRDFFGIQR